MVAVKFDKESRLSYGTWECPECKNRFYPGGQPLHFSNQCSLKGQGYEPLTYYCTNRELEEWQRSVSTGEKSYQPSFLVDYFSDHFGEALTE